MTDKIATGDRLSARLTTGGDVGDYIRTAGLFTAVFRDASGEILHEEMFPNLLTTFGKDLLLNTTLNPAAYTAVGPYMGLIGGAAPLTIVASDTLASKTNAWLECGSANPPTFSGSGARIICVWSASSGGVKALSAGLTFTFTGSGTVQGAFIVTSTGAVVTNGSTAGTLYSAGNLTTAQPVISTNTLTLSYSTTLT